MNTSDTSGDQDKFKEAGEQAARVLGEFVSIANDFSRRIEKEFDSHRDAVRPSPSETQTHSDSQSSNSHNATDYLHELSDAASSAMGGFANGFRTGNQDRGEWSGQRSAEWMDQAAELLKQRNPADFFDTLKGYCESPGAAQQDDSEQTRLSSRQEQLNQIFSDRAALDDLTESQFEELLEFMQSNYKAALQLVGKR